MKELENLKELYLDEIKKINKKGELTPTDAEAANKAIEAIKKIEEICACCDDMDEGYSERMYPRHSMRYSQRNRMPDMNSGYSEMYPYYYNDRMYSDRGYSDGYSDRRGRSASTGRYISRHNGLEVENMIHKLEAMRPEAPDNETKMAIDNVIRKLEAY